MILHDIRKELKANIDAEYQKTIQRFFKEPVKVFGVRTPMVRKIAKKYFREVEALSKAETFALCEKLLQTGYGEEHGIAFIWAFNLKEQYTSADFVLFESWLERYVTNWGACDHLCCSVLGDFLHRFPQYMKKVQSWTRSDNRWVRRASAVILIYSIQRDTYIDDAFDIADRLLTDEDDMVQKGYGWMLKVVGNRYPKRVFDYVMAHKSVMPRTALRYAIEKLSPELKKRAMAK